MSDNNVPFGGVESAPTESSEGRRARNHKLALTYALDGLIEAMEDARKDGFTVEFSVGLQPEPDQRYVLANLALIKRW